jgi:hypothetical protein
VQFGVQLGCRVVARGEQRIDERFQRGERHVGVSARPVRRAHRPDDGEHALETQRRRLAFAALFVGGDDAHTLLLLERHLV